VPLLGICVGLQWLFEGSDEAPGVPGLGLLKGTCFPFTPNVSERRKVPHVGWNSLTITRPSRLMTGVKNGAQVYFTHSYAAPLCDDTVATCDYGGAFTAAAERGHISAVQFHPEKSGDAGLRILSNWINAL
jgi:glutamine amidotransferase